jgi:hypothetical protein
LAFCNALINKSVSCSSSDTSLADGLFMLKQNRYNQLSNHELNFHVNTNSYSEIAEIYINNYPSQIFYKDSIEDTGI